MQHLKQRTVFLNHCKQLACPLLHYSWPCTCVLQTLKRWRSATLPASTSTSLDQLVTAVHAPTMLVAALQCMLQQCWSLHYGVCPNKLANLHGHGTSAPHGPAHCTLYLIKPAKMSTSLASTQCTPQRTSVRTSANLHRIQHPCKHFKNSSLQCCWLAAKCAKTYPQGLGLALHFIVATSSCPMHFTVLYVSSVPSALIVFVENRMTQFIQTCEYKVKNAQPKATFRVAA
eukprot:1156529-Pelagomonas_calceolata.AAC.4